MKKKLQKRLRRVASHTLFTLKQYLPRIREKFAPSTEIAGELEDCQEALEDVFKDISAEKVKLPLFVSGVMGTNVSRSRSQKEMRIRLRELEEVAALERIRLQHDPELAVKIATLRWVLGLEDKL